MTMPKTFMQMAKEAMAAVPSVSAQEAQRRLKEDPRTLVVDVRDDADTRDGVIPGALKISLGMLPVRADAELPEAWRHKDLQDRARPIITVCALGPNSARGARDLKEMGFSNVSYLEGGMEAWAKAGLPVKKA
jgi:rhodanese-related sulfurtransferase